MNRPVLRWAEDALGASKLAADVIEEMVDQKPNAVLALPTGRTPLPLYDELAARADRRQVDFRRIRAFNLDEWVGVDPEEPGSYARFMADEFYSRVNLPRAGCFIPNGLAADPQAECNRYDALLRAAGGIDLAVLGIGRNGHIGFNEPGTSPDLRTHVARVTEDTRQANAYGFPDGNPPRHAYTMGIRTILEARAILLLATGPEKADVLARALTGPVTTDLPASFLQRHARVIVVGDAAALVFRHAFEG